MAITIASSPQSPTPAYNEQSIVATSNLTAQPNFYYTIILTDVTGSYVFDTIYIKPNPANKLVMDLGAYAEKLMVNYIPVNLYGWKKCTGATRKFRFNVGETYDVASVATYFAGSNVDYIVSNAGLDKIYMAPYTPNSICYDSSLPNIVFGTTLPSKTYVDRSMYLYVLCQTNVNELFTIQIKTYDSTGTLLGSYNIDRPDASTSLYTDQYQCIDLGYKGLLGITVGLVSINSGTYPIITSSVASYTITDIYDPGNPTTLQTVTIACNPKFEVYTLHYLNSKGGYQTLNCNLLATLTTSKSVTSFKKSGWSLVANVMTLDPALANEKVQSVTIQDNLQLNSDWLTQAEFDLHKDLFTSTDIRLDVGSTTTYKGVKCTQTSYTQKNDSRLRNYQIDLSYTHQNNRQRG